MTTVRKKKNKEKHVNLQFRLDEQMFDKLKKRADDNYRSMNQEARVLIEQGLSAK